MYRFLFTIVFFGKRKNNTHQTFHILKVKAHFKKEPQLSIPHNKLPSIQSESTLDNKSPKLSFKCYVCNANFEDNPMLEMYLASVDEEKTLFKCNVCWVKSRHFCAPSK